MKREFHFSIDRGGTFTDVFAQVCNIARAASSGCTAHSCAAAPLTQHRPRIHAQVPDGKGGSTYRRGRGVSLCSRKHACACMPLLLASTTPPASSIRAKTLCRVLKLLSEDPSNYPDAPREGIRRVLEAVTGVPHPR